MIRAFLASLRRAPLRQIVGIVALLAVVFVVFLGAAHAGEDGAAHRDCGVCFAAAACFAVETLDAPQLTGRTAEEPAPNPVETRDAVVHAPRRRHASRAPPCSA